MKDGIRIPTFILSAFLVAWIGLQATMFQKISTLETQVAVLGVELKNHMAAGKIAVQP